MKFFACLAAAVTLAAATPASADIIVSLTTPSPTFTDSTGAQFSLTAYQPTGSGVFLPFMRISRPSESQGYNSSLNNSPNATMDLINLPGNSTSQILFGNAVTPDGRILLTLDYNEQGAPGRSLITLAELTLVVSSDPDKTGPIGPGPGGLWSIQSIPMSAGDQVIYQMSTATDAGGNAFTILMDADNNPASGNGGSGAADLNVAINLSGVANLAELIAGDKYLYVYSRFSGTGAGFEEWNIFDAVNNPNGGGGQPIPEPASLGLLGIGAVALLARRRRN